MFKFIHIADIHFDTPMHSNGNNKDILIDALYDSFNKVIDLCIKKDCDALLIAGDLFDNETLSFRSEIIINNGFTKLKKNNIQVYYCLGNHDPKNPNISIQNQKDNVHVFDSHSPRCEELIDKHGNIIAKIFGSGFETANVYEDIVEKYPTNESNIPTVGLFHTQVDSYQKPSPYAPSTFNSLLSKNYSYWALGHIHMRGEFGSKISPIIYSGCLSPRHIGECGIKGVYYVELQENTLPYYEFIPISNILWSIKEIKSLSNVNSANDLKEICLKQLNSIDLRYDNFVRIILNGSCGIHDKLDKISVNDLEDAISVESGCRIQIKNNTHTLISPNDYRDDIHLLSSALSLCDELKTDPEKYNEILPYIVDTYKNLDGGYDIEYIKSLLSNIDYILCNTMLKKDK